MKKNLKVSIVSVVYIAGYDKYTSLMRDHWPRVRSVIPCIYTVSLNTPEDSMLYTSLFLGA